MDKEKPTDKQLVLIGNAASPHCRIRAAGIARRYSGPTAFLDTDQKPGWKAPPLQYSWIAVPVALNIPKIRGIIRVVRAVKLIRDLKPATLFVFYLDTFAILLLLTVRCRYFVSVWGGDLLEAQGALRSPLLRRLAGRVLRRAEKVFCVSQELVKRTCELTGNYTQNMPVLQHYGVDLQQLSYRPPSSVMDKVAARLFCPRWPLPVYNVETVVRAVAKVQEHDPTVSLVLRNEYLKPESGTLRTLSKVEELVASSPSPDNFEYLGFVTPKELSAAYDKSHIIISLSFSDGTPVTILEAMAKGKIVICGRIPSLEAIIQDGVNGFLVDANDEDQVARLILSIVQNLETHARTIGPAARRFVEESADLDKEIDAYLRYILHTNND